jgi:O-acetyl-ADP-ribose deacetylase (regulator of RNase III)
MPPDLMTDDELALVIFRQGDHFLSVRNAAQLLGGAAVDSGAQLSSSTSVLIHERHLSPTVAVQLRLGDIALEHVDVIVNAANGDLQHGAGVAAALLRAAGNDWQRESSAHVRRHGPVAVGGVAVTSAGDLRARCVVHAVGPVWRGGTHGEEAQLRSAVRNSLRVAHMHELASIALPAISSGIFGFDKAQCATILFD